MQPNIQPGTPVHFTPDGPKTPDGKPFISLPTYPNYIGFRTTNNVEYALKASYIISMSYRIHDSVLTVRYTDTTTEDITGVAEKTWERIRKLIFPET